MNNKRKVRQAPVMSPMRGTLNRIRSRARKYGLKTSDVREFELVMYAKYSQRNNILKFEAIEGTGKANVGQHPLEILCPKTDVVWCAEAALGIHKVLLNNGIEQSGNTQPVYYPDPNWFPGNAGAFPTEAQSLEMTYNGTLRFMTKNDQRLSDLSTSQFRHVPDQQYEVGPPVKVIRQEGSEYVKLQNNFGVWGNKSNTFEVLLADEGDYSQVEGVAGDHVNYAVLKLKGFIMVGGAQAVTVSDANQIFA